MNKKILVIVPFPMNKDQLAANLSLIGDDLPGPNVYGYERGNVNKKKKQNQKSLQNLKFQVFDQSQYGDIVGNLGVKITGKITEIDEKMLKLELDSENKIYGFIKKVNLSKDKNEQKVDRFALQEQVDSIIISVDQKTRTLNLSIKEIEINDEKEALSKYGSSDSGASLGDILGSILKKKE